MEEGSVEGERGVVRQGRSISARCLAIPGTGTQLQGGDRI